MHELSIAQSIVDIAERQAKEKKSKKIASIELAIGELSGVELEALRFCWPEATANTMLANAELKIDHVQGEAYCLTCEKEFQLSNIYDICPFCNSYKKEIIRGKELAVKKIEIIH